MQQKFLEKTLGQQIADMAAKYPDDNMIDYTDRDYSRTWKEFNDYLLRRGIRLEFVKRTREIKKAGGHTGNPVTKDGQTFKASQISREFSFARLNARLGWKTSESQQESEREVQQRIPDGGHLLESTGPGLFSPTSGTAPEEPLSQEELLRRRRKKKQKRKGFGL